MLYAKLLLIFVSINLLFPISENLATYSKLNKLVTKQSIQNIRFISIDGRFTYYQKAPGELVLSNNFALDSIIKGPINTQFMITASLDRKKVIIAMDPFSFSSNDILHSYYLYQASFGSSISVPLGKGLSPQLHIKDQWVSYLIPTTKKVKFISLINGLSFEIFLRNKINPYFIPQVLMYSEKEILYTDINDDGFEGVLLLDRNTNKTSNIFKSSQKGIRLELCLKNESVILGEFSHPGVHNNYPSKIGILYGKTFNSYKPLYTSDRDDIGHIICQTNGPHLYFIKSYAYQPLPNTTESEVAKISVNTETQTPEKISDLQNVTQIINLDGRILVPYQGDYYVIEGPNELKPDSLK